MYLNIFIIKLVCFGLEEIGEIGREKDKGRYNWFEGKRWEYFKKCVGYVF